MLLVVRLNALGVFPLVVTAVVLVSPSWMGDGASEEGRSWAEEYEPGVGVVRESSAVTGKRRVEEYQAKNIGTELRGQRMRDSIKEERRGHLLYISHLRNIKKGK